MRIDNKKIEEWAKRLSDTYEPIFQQHVSGKTIETKSGYRETNLTSIVARQIDKEIDELLSDKNVEIIGNFEHSKNGIVKQIMLIASSNANLNAAKKGCTPYLIGFIIFIIICIIMGIRG